ncbi:hypothetical protein BH23CHL4_BH23CHL4_01460 [soil metagenome]
MRAGMTQSAEALAAFLPCGLGLDVLRAHGRGPQHNFRMLDAK